MALSLSRNAKLYVTTQVDIDETGNVPSQLNTWEIPILDGFSFSAATATQEIEISEAGLTPSRGQQIFTTAKEPVNWSIQTYMRPRYITNTPLRVDAVERILWEGLFSKFDNGATSASGTDISTTADGTATSVAPGAADTGMNVSLLQSAGNELVILQLIFNLGTDAAPQWFWIKNAVVDTCEIDFAIDAIASASWGGFGDDIIRVDSGAGLSNLNAMAAGGVNMQLTDPTSADGYVMAPTGTQACIRNKLSTVSLVGNTAPYNDTYNVALTGGSLSIANNITYLTPEALGVVNLPCGHITGQRQVSGTMTAYLKSDASGTADLMSAVSSVTSAAPLDFSLDIFIGGADPGAGPYTYPVVQLQMPFSHIVIPTINIEDVVSIEIPFTALPYATGPVNDPDENNELEVIYYADES